MKKILLILAMLLMLSTACFAFAGCDYTTGEIGKIDYDPESKTIYWEPVSGADNYTVFENGKRLLNTNDTKFLVSSLREDVSYITVAPTKYMKDTGLSEEYLYITKGSDGIKYTILEDKSGYHATLTGDVPKGTVIYVQSVYEDLPVTQVSVLKSESVIPDTIKEFSMGEFQYKTFRLPLSLEIFYWTDVNCESYSVSKHHNLYTVQDGILYNKDLTVLISYPRLKKVQKYVMPDSIVEINSGGICLEEPYLKNLILSINLEKIAFASIYAVGVMELQIPSKIKLTEYSIAFFGSKLILQEGITNLPNSAITLGGNMTQGNNNCEIYFPKSIIDVEINAIINNKQNKELKVTLHCAAKEKPKGWHEKWQKDCEVIWGENW